MVTKYPIGRLLPTPSNESVAMIGHPCQGTFHRGEPAAHADSRIVPLCHWFQCKLASEKCAAPWVCEWPPPMECLGIPEETHRSPMCNTLHFMSIACYIDSKVNDHDPHGKLSREDNRWAVLGSAQIPQRRARSRHTVCRRIGHWLGSLARRTDDDPDNPARLKPCLVALGCCSLPLRPQNHCSRATQTSQQ